MLSRLRNEFYLKEKEVRNDFQNDLFYLDDDAFEDGNHYLTADSKIDIVNWETSEIWKR